MRSPRLVLGDQLDLAGAALRDIDPSQYAVVMIEAASESMTVWSSKPRIAIFLAEVRPVEVADWYLAVYVDAVEWAELPNVVGMALHAQGDRFTSKPYIASGVYLDRMSDYCKGRRHEPSRRVDALGTARLACPVTTLYWNFLARNRDALAVNPRTSMMVKNYERLGDDERAAIAVQAAGTLDAIDTL